MALVSQKILGILDKLFEKRRWLLSQLRALEEKYKMKTKDFLEKWRNGEFPEPEDPEIHSDFMIWEGLAEDLKKVESEISRYISGEKNVEDS
ncbi:MAG: hypothetical protein Q6363_000435 [Candidatus Njordarchaeota archaeon]